MQPTYVPVWMRKPVAAARRRQAARRDRGGRLPARVARDRRARDPRRRLSWTSTRSRSPASGTARSRPAPTRSTARRIRPTAAGSGATWSSAIYFADSEPTAWAEWYRALAEAAIPPGQALPRDLWRWGIDLPRVADLGDEAPRPVGLPPLAHAPAVAGVPGGRRAAARGGLARAGERVGGPSRGPHPVRVPHRARVAGATPVPPPRRVADPPVVPTGLRT